MLPYESLVVEAVSVFYRTTPANIECASAFASLRTAAATL